MVASLSQLRQHQAEALLPLLTRGECCAVYGLSNTGKSPFLRALASPAYQAQYARLAQRSGVLVYVDCNRVIELTAPGFYELVVRAALETLSSLHPAGEPAALLQSLQELHTRIINSASAFQASLAFNQALAECCQHADNNLLILLDEFVEVYAALEPRTLLNLRALKDKFSDTLVYLTATARPLTECRAASEDEFSELFAAHTFPLGHLPPADAEQVLDSLSGEVILAPQRQQIIELAGGHFGLLNALAQAAVRNPNPAALLNDPGARAECLKIWNQLRGPEQTALTLLVTEAEAGINPLMHHQLQTLGLLTATGQIFSTLFAGFVRRQHANAGATAMGIVVDEDAGEVWVDGVKVTVLTDLEYKLMRLLAQRQNRLTTKDQIVTTVWGTEYIDSIDDARIEKLVSRLRAKIEADPAHPRYLLTQRGRGYKLADPPTSAKPAEEKE